ncbi:MAG: hypothetical protein CMJ64_06550 [Planctomycetaceae bacterium]|nr:hypothetical protein [Planctomycetaceae bacterium]
MHVNDSNSMTTDRRGFLRQVSGGISAAALLSLLSEDGFVWAGDETGHTSRRVYDLKPRVPHHAPKAKSIIHLFMNGGPSQMDLFDPKIELDKKHGKSYFEKIAGEVENPSTAGALMKSPFKFKQHGASGMWVSEVMPHLAKCVDDIALIRSMFTTNLTHEPALFKIHSGRTLPGLPSLGTWVTYGLGTVNQNLPAYVVLDDPKGLPVNLTQNWQAGFLPPVYQGTRFRSKGSPVLDLKPEFQEPASITRLERDLISQLDQLHKSKRPSQPELGARIASYELAARMQLAASDALDLSHESSATRTMYGLGEEPTDSYGRRCLIARRLVERGVRFVQLFLEHQPWDNHTGLANGIKSSCARTDQPIAALLKDLKRRGLLESTLVVWGGEFGRLPIAQGDDGRDHNKNAMVTWMAGGGIKGGLTYGSTDEIGFAAADQKVSVPDWHATILHLLGLDYQKLSYYRNGLEEKLTSVFDGRIVKEIVA